MAKQPIHILPDHIINKIAAGEVVERPASVVKELIENAIDAASKQIKVRVEKGGNQLIEVSDDGSGMNLENAKLAFVQHATSKINKEDDLYHISTMGFRGEALASIASVAEASIHTFDGTSKPISVTVTNDKIQAVSGSGRRQGTTVTIHNIFFKIPARRKFLRLENTEYKYVLDTFISLALANPQIAFSLEKDGKTTYDLKAGNSYTERIKQLFTKEAQGKLLPVSYQDSEIAIQGSIGHPNLAKNYAQAQYLFLNNRPIKDNLLTKAVKDGFGTTLMKGMYPMYFLYLAMKPDLFDINVHPRKTEAKFYNPQKVFYAVKHSISHTLETKLQAEFYQRVNLDRISPLPGKNTTPKSLKLPKVKEISASLEFSKELLEPIKDILQKRPDFLPAESLPGFYQIFNTYLLIERDNKLLVIDQHAADERVNYEKLNTELALNKKITSIPLLIPETLQLNPKENSIIINHLKTFRQLGFTVEPFSKTEHQLTEIPEFLQDHDYLTALKEILNDLDDYTTPNNALAKAAHKVISTIACHASIRAGQKLTPNLANYLINNLFKCELPYSCPHGRPIIWELNRTDLEKKFKRKL